MIIWFILGFIGSILMLIDFIQSGEINFADIFALLLSILLGPIGLIISALHYGHDLVVWRKRD